MNQRIYLTIVIALLLVISPVFAATITNSDFSALKVTSDRELYSAGEAGIVYIEARIAEQIKDAELAVSIVSPEGVMIGGAVVYTEVPEQTIINSGYMQTEQIILKEDFSYVLNNTITREIYFTIPAAAPTGDYTINARFLSDKNDLSATAKMSVLGSNAVDEMLVIYIIVILIFVFKIYFDFYHTKSIKI